MRTPRYWNWRKIGYWGFLVLFTWTFARVATFSVLAIDGVMIVLARIRFRSWLQQGGSKRCGGCSEWAHADATLCPHCQAELTPPLAKP